MNNIRNFSIIAHVDHGKSTLSDRIIQICGGFPKNEINNQILDTMDLERERGITIKAQSVTLNYKATNGETYQLNLIDTPGHIDFSHEVSRSLAACEGALLVVDIKQGIEAQTLTNCRTAIEMNLKIIPVINKIDLPNVNSKCIVREIEDIIGIDSSNIVFCSAKTGIGVTNLLERLIYDIPPPTGKSDAPLQALVIDSWFNNYLGVILLIKIKNGIIRKGDRVRLMNTNQVYNVNRLGIFTPKQIDRTELKCGEVGWMSCSNKNILSTLVGDTLTGDWNPAEKALPNFKKVKPQVYANLFPIDSKDYKMFHNALNKLSLNDASLFYELENSSILGYGFHCGFLGLLHMEIIQERLKREHKLRLITTAPTVTYEVYTIDNKVIYVNNPSKLPPSNNITELREPIAECHILSPQKYLGNIITLCAEKRGIQINVDYYDKQVALTYEIPMAEVIFDFASHLKSLSHGYASLNYNFKHFQNSEIVCVNILINGNNIDALSLIIHKSNALHRGRELVKKLKDLIPRQQFDIKIQAAINNKIITSSVIKPLRKNVIARCYGGDISRKKKLLEKQKQGKKQMKQIGNIKIPQEAFLTILNIDKKINNY